MRQRRASAPGGALSKLKMLALEPLSRAQIDWGNPRDAVPALTALLEDDDASFEARYLLGLARLRLAERSVDLAWQRRVEFPAQQRLRLGADDLADHPPAVEHQHRRHGQHAVAQGDVDPAGGRQVGEIALRRRS